ncbi:MAG TPA: hypothetical protein VMW30_07700 [Candidatus Paceibacterota bacterium]|nr:hypothetical protein [Candidatus Paceibacterota bacterium]
MKQDDQAEVQASLSLPAGVSEDQILKAVAKSGYPLQTVVSHKLRQVERVQQQPEWGFLDRTTGDMRALDILATINLADDNPNKFRVRAGVALLIECKRSDLPYVFFTESESPYGNFPHVSGLKSELLVVKTDDDRSTWNLPILFTLGLDRHKFILSPSSCVTFSRCERKGQDIVLSGSDPYQSIVLPLRSAVDHYRSALTPPSTAHYFDAQLVVALSVIDAPMLSAVVSDDGTTTLQNVQWQRLWRNEPDAATPSYEHGETSAIDIVHVDYLEEYLESHLLPFSREFAQRAHAHHEELASSKAFIRGMGQDSWTNLHERLEPQKVSLPMTDRKVQENLVLSVARLARDGAKIKKENVRLRRNRHR